MNKKKLKLLFNKISLKFYLNTKNLTAIDMPLDLVREEIHLLISVVITLEVKVALAKLSQVNLEKISLSFLFDNVIQFLLLSSKQKIFSILSLGEVNALESSNQWLLKRVKFEEYFTIFTILKSINSTEPFHSSSFNLLINLIENLIIKLTNYMIYEVFSSKKISRSIYLKVYTMDYLLFLYNLNNLKTYSYWKFYIENIYSNIKRFSTDTYPLLICTKNGLELKRLYIKEIQVNSRSSKLQNLIYKSLNFIDYLKNVNRF